MRSKTATAELLAWVLPALKSAPIEASRFAVWLFFVNAYLR
jgi:hypothetical protein